MDEWERICPNISFTAKNKMGNLHKKGWSHFKLNPFHPVDFRKL